MIRKDISWMLSLPSLELLKVVVVVVVLVLAEAVTSSQNAEPTEHEVWRETAPFATAVPAAEGPWMAGGSVTLPESVALAPPSPTNKALAGASPPARGRLRRPRFLRRSRRRVCGGAAHTVWCSLGVQFKTYTFCVHVGWG